MQICFTAATFRRAIQCNLTESTTFSLQRAQVRSFSLFHLSGRMMGAARIMQEQLMGASLISVKEGSRQIFLLKKMVGKL